MALPTMTVPTVRDIMAFHNDDRMVYEKLLMHGTHPGLARDLVCLFMCLDQLVVVDVTHGILILWMRNHPAVAPLLAEAEAILHYIQQDDNTNGLIEFPCLTKLLCRCVDTNYIDQYKDRILKSMTHKINGIGRVIFEDYLYEILHAYETNMNIAEQEASRWGWVRMPPALPSELTRPYHPIPELATPEDDQSIFINPLAEGALDYFA